MTKRAAIGWTIVGGGLLLVVLRASLDTRGQEPKGSVREGVDVGSKAGAGQLRSPPTVNDRGEARVVLASTIASVGIAGTVSLPGDALCRSGFAFAWRDGLVPIADDFQDMRAGRKNERVNATRIQDDGSFFFPDLSADTTYTLSAVAQGAACVLRPTGIPVGSKGVNLRLMFTYGVAIRLEELGGGPLRTTPLLFGGGPKASGPVQKLQENPPELQALSIEGLQAGHGTRDRWQYLAVSELQTGALGPIDFEIEVPGYRSRKELVPVSRMVRQLDEFVLALEPSASSWGAVDVRLVGSPQVLALGLEASQIVGVVYLTQSEEPQAEFAVHALAFGGSELVSGVPAGTYSARFEAADAYYETEPREIEIGPNPRRLEFDCSGSGSLFIDVTEDERAHDMRFIAGIEETDGEHSTRGAHFFVTFNSGPYVVPVLWPGRYRLNDLEVPGRDCVSLDGGEVEIFAGRVSVALVGCHRSPLPGAIR